MYKRKGKTGSLNAEVDTEKKRKTTVGLFYAIG